MRSKTPCDQVVDYASSTLTESDQARFEAHLAACNACRGWLEARQLLAQELSCSQQAPSLLMARVAADDGTLDPMQRRRLEAHLEVCGVCRRELELSRRAIRAAAKPIPAERTPTRFGRLRRPSLGVAVAAGLALIVVAAGVWLQRGPQGHLPKPSMAEAEVLQADRQLVLQDLRVERGARLVARASESVVLGNGFTVDSGGSLIIALGEGEPIPYRQ